MDLELSQHPHPAVPRPGPPPSPRAVPSAAPCWDSTGTGDGTGDGAAAQCVGMPLPTCCRELNPQPWGCSPQGPPESSSVAVVVLRLLWGPFPPLPPTAAVRSAARRPGELPARMKAALCRSPTAPTARDGPRGAALRSADGDGGVRSPGKSARSFGLSVSPHRGRLPSERGSGALGVWERDRRGGWEPLGVRSGVGGCKPSWPWLGKDWAPLGWGSRAAPTEPPTTAHGPVPPGPRSRDPLPQPALHPNPTAAPLLARTAPPSPAHTAPAHTRTHGAPTLCAPTSNTHTRTHTPSSTHPAPTRPAQPRAPPSPAAHLQPPPPQDAGLVHSAAPPPPAAPAPPGAPGAPPSGPGTARHGTGVAGSGAGSTTVPSSPDGPAQ